MRPGVSSSVLCFSRRELLLFLAAGAAGCKRASDLPALGSVGSFSLTDQAGRPVSAQTLRGKVWAAAFFFTRCPTVCPRHHPPHA